MWVFYSLSIARLTLNGFLAVDAALVVTWSAEEESATIGNCIMSGVGCERAGGASVHFLSRLCTEYLRRVLCRVYCKCVFVE